MADFSSIPGLVRNLNGEIVINIPDQNSFYQESAYASNSLPTRIELEPTTASEFRKNLNQNFMNIVNSFEKIDEEIENVYDNMVGIVVSENQPDAGMQKNGDIWFHVI